VLDREENKERKAPVFPALKNMPLINLAQVLGHELKHFRRSHQIAAV
jgi:hypothetical protein